MKKYSHLLPITDVQEASTLTSQAHIVLKGHVGFGFHSSSGLYVLFVVMPGVVVPAFLERLDQAGNVWEIAEKQASLEWDKATASILLPAISWASSSHDNGGNNDSWDENITFGNGGSDEDDNEVDAIRRILVDELKNVNHPSRHFLLPLAQAMHGKLEKWRTCLKIRPRLPVLNHPNQPKKRRVRMTLWCRTTMISAK